MGAVILAAGRGERLAGYAAPYMKPLLIVNGQPLIVQQMRNALEVTTEITLVLAPENARFMIDLIHGAMNPNWSTIDVVVQPFSGTSVTDALNRGLRFSDGPVVVLMGDNVVPPLLVRDMWDSMSRFTGTDVLVATQVVPYNDAKQHFTYREGDGPWVEKQEAPYHIVGAETEAWIGPLIIDEPRDFMVAMMDMTSIGETFNKFTDVRTFPCLCSDVGVPKALQ
jgi:choline kinase